MQPVTAAVVLFLYTGMALGCGLDMERYLRFVFMVYIVMLILQKVTVHIAATAATPFLSLLVFKAHYYTFEKEKVK